MKTLRNGICLTALTGVLSACGGGGGSPPAQGIPAIQEEFESGIERSSSSASMAEPNSGSVTQSSNTRNGVTTDKANAVFDGSGVMLTITRGDGSTTVLDPETNLENDDVLETAIPGHTARSYDVVDEGEGETTAALVFVSSNAGATDYLAGGYWINVQGDLRAASSGDFEVGAFVDGPGLEGRDSMPSIGTARYLGPAGGLVYYRYGSGRGSIQEGTVAISEYVGQANLEADFGAGTISGCIGCVGGLEVAGALLAPDGTTGWTEDDVSYRIRLGAASFDETGWFTGTDVSVEHDGVTGVVSTDGSWGGQFSSIDAGGDPRAVAGTNGASWSEDDGSEGRLIGAFGAGATN